MTVLFLSASWRFLTSYFPKPAVAQDYLSARRDVNIEEPLNFTKYLPLKNKKEKINQLYFMTKNLAINSEEQHVGSCGSRCGLPLREIVSFLYTSKHAHSSANTQNESIIGIVTDYSKTETNGLPLSQASCNIQYSTCQ